MSCAALGGTTPPGTPSTPERALGAPDTAPAAGTAHRTPPIPERALGAPDTAPAAGTAHRRLGAPDTAPEAGTGAPEAGTGRRQPPLVCVAHGSADPRAAATVGSLLDVVRERAPGTDVRVAFLGHAAPSVPSVLASLGNGPVVVLPLLLTAAYHSKVDLPAQLSGVDARIHYGPVLGPHPLLLDAAERRVASTGPFDRACTGVVLAAAGSSDPGANATIRQVAAQWRERGGWRAVMPAYASAAPPTVAEAVAALRDVPGVRRVLVATYLIAPGQFADQILVSALQAGADAVTPALGALPEIADLILERYMATVSSLRAGAA